MIFYGFSLCDASKSVFVDFKIRSMITNWVIKHIFGTDHHKNDVSKRNLRRFVDSNSRTPWFGKFNDVLEEDFNPNSDCTESVLCVLQCVQCESVQCVLQIRSWNDSKPVMDWISPVLNPGIYTCIPLWPETFLLHNSLLQTALQLSNSRIFWKFLFQKLDEKFEGWHQYHWQSWWEHSLGNW